LLRLSEDSSSPTSSLLSKYLKVDERVASYLLDSDELDHLLRPYVKHIEPKTRLEDLVLPDDVKRRLALLTRQQTNTNRGPVWYFQGPYGVGKQTTAEALCHELGMGLLVIDGERLVNQQEGDFSEAVRLAVRETLLQKAALYWRGIDPLLEESKRPLLEVLVTALEEQPGLAFLAGNTTWEPADALRQALFVRLEFPRPNPAERAQLWTRSLNGDFADGLNADLQGLASKFRLSGGQIKDAVATARNLARWRDPQDSRLSIGGLYAASRLQSNRKLAALAQKITPHYQWEDIVLPPDRM
jgi:SpoVK/Ycf46/Vps4 family AAA+-type ATPase